MMRKTRPLTLTTVCSARTFVCDRGPMKDTSGRARACSHDMSRCFNSLIANILPSPSVPRLPYNRVLASDSLAEEKRISIHGWCEVRTRFSNIGSLDKGARSSEMMTNVKPCSFCVFCVLWRLLCTCFYSLNFTIKAETVKQTKKAFPPGQTTQYNNMRIINITGM